VSVPVPTKNRADSELKLKTYIEAQLELFLVITGTKRSGCEIGWPTRKQNILE